MQQQKMPVILQISFARHSKHSFRNSSKMIKPLKAIKASTETTYPKLESRKKLPQILKHCCRHTVISWTAMQSTMIRPNWMYWNTWCTKREISSVCWSHWNRLNPPQKTKLLYRQRHQLGSKWGQSKFCGIAKWCEELEKPPHFKWNTVVLWQAAPF